MRGQLDPRGQMFSYFSPESRVPAEHPLRSIKAHTDRVLKELCGELDALYSETGRPSIPPERLLKGQLLIALYSVRSDRREGCRCGGAGHVVVDVVTGAHLVDQ